MQYISFGRDPFVRGFSGCSQETKDTLPCNYLISVDLSGKDGVMVLWVERFDRNISSLRLASFEFYVQKLKKHDIYI